MRKKVLFSFAFSVLVSVVLFFSLSCKTDGIWNAVKGIIPKLKTGHPNVIYGNWAVQSEFEGYYKFKLQLGADGKYVFSVNSDPNQTQRGEYKIEYSHLDILESTGKITFSPSLKKNDLREYEEAEFSYKADRYDGPQELRINGYNVSEEFLFLDR